MGHPITHDTYRNLGKRINWFTQGAPTSETLYKILQVLYPEKEAKWMTPLPVRPFTIKKVAKIWGTLEYKAEKLLDRLYGKTLPMGSWDKGMRKFAMPPSMTGSVEFALMRTRGDIDQKYLNELYCRYMNAEESFIKNLFHTTETRLGRVFAQGLVLTNDKMNHILNYEWVTCIVEEAGYTGLGLYYYCHKMSHAGHLCETNAPWDACLTFGNMVRSLAQHGDYCRLISGEEMLDALERFCADNLVQIGKNVWEHLAFIYDCCGYCCEALQAARHFSPMQPVVATNYIPDVTGNQCVGCGKCIRTCPVLAIFIEEGENGRKRAVADKDICLGCGICDRNCGVKAIHMERKTGQIITPVHSTHRFVLQAIEKGISADLVLDNQMFSNHRTMVALFSVILEPPPPKQTMASKQFKSVYLDRLLAAGRKKGWIGRTN